MLQLNLPLIPQRKQAIKNYPRGLVSNLFVVVHFPWLHGNHKRQCILIFKPTNSKVNFVGSLPSSYFETTWRRRGQILKYHPIHRSLYVETTVNQRPKCDRNKQNKTDIQNLLSLAFPIDLNVSLKPMNSVNLMISTGTRIEIRLKIHRTV